MNLENKKQIAIVLLAVGLGLVAAVLTGNHIKDSIKKETARLSQDFENKRVKPLMQELENLRKDVKKLASRQMAVAAAGGGGPGGVQQAPSPPPSSLALRTPARKRAYTVRIDALSAVGGLINPGDYVDIISHLEMPDPVTNRKDTVTSMVFQNVQILAVGTNLQAPGGYEAQQQARALNITLALTPEETSLISFIQKNGKLQMTLRAPAETDTEVMRTADWSALADYVFERQGTELVVPRTRAIIEQTTTGKKEEVKPFIEIFRRGKE